MLIAGTINSEGVCVNQHMKHQGRMESCLIVLYRDRFNSSNCWLCKYIICNNVIINWVKMFDVANGAIFWIFPHFVLLSVWATVRVGRNGLAASEDTPLSHIPINSKVISWKKYYICCHHQLCFVVDVIPISFLWMKWRGVRRDMLFSSVLCKIQKTNNFSNPTSWRQNVRDQKNFEIAIC